MKMLNINERFKLLLVMSMFTHVLYFRNTGTDYDTNMFHRTWENLKTAVITQQHAEVEKSPTMLIVKHQIPPVVASLNTMRLKR